MLGLGFPTETAQKRRPERVTVVDEHVVVRAFRPHAAKAQRDELIGAVRLYQPFAVAVLRVVVPDRAVRDDAPRIGEDPPGFITGLKINCRISYQNEYADHDSGQGEAHYSHCAWLSKFRLVDFEDYHPRRGRCPSSTTPLNTASRMHPNSVRLPRN